MPEKPTYEELEKTNQALAQEVLNLNRAKEKLLEEKSFSQTLLQAAPVFYVAIGADGRVILINDVMLDSLGYIADEVIGKDYLTTFVPKKDQGTLSRVFQKLVILNEPTLNENHILTRGGKERLVEWHGRSIFNIKGEFDYFFGVGIDITERKSAELALRESDEKYRSMMEALKEDVYSCTPDFRIDYINPAMLKKIGRQASGEFCYAAIYKRDNKCPWCVFDQVKEKKSVEYELKNPVDHRFYSITNFPIVHLDGSVSKLSIARDITDVKTIKEQLHQAQKMEAIGRLAGGIAHDFNNLLSGIFGFSQLAKSHIHNPVRAVKDIDQIIKGAQKATDLVQQILTFSRKTEHIKKLFQLSREVKDAVRLIRSTIPSNIEIKEDIASPAIVLADPTQVHQIVMNLCTNAYHSMGEKGGVLSISLKETEICNQDSVPDQGILPGRYIKLEVSDTGSGMNSQVLGQIFEPYFTTKKVGEGTGLGLAVVLGVVREHKGYVTASSEPGKGSVFGVYFPMVENQTIDCLPEKQIPALQGGTENIMVVDDEESIYTSTCELLEDFGYTVSTFSDAAHGFEAFQKDPDFFDLIITDLTMPLMSGYELAAKVLNIRKKVPIILCSGYSETMTESKAQALGIRKYLLKPVDSQTLLHLIRELLDGMS